MDERMHSSRISLTDFVDFVARPGMGAKLSKVREIKHRGPYSTSSDYYRPVREAVIRTHAGGRDKWDIRDLLAQRDHLERLGFIADAYIGWWGQRRLEWFEPGWHMHNLQGLPFSVNPELGLEIDGRPHLVKLYFKENELQQPLADVAARMMFRVLSEQSPRDTAMAILDIRRRRLWCMTRRPDLDVLLDAEVAAFTAMWAAA
jgi:hypothetical protein